MAKEFLRSPESGTKGFAEGGLRDETAKKLSTRGVAACAVRTLRLLSLRSQQVRYWVGMASRHSPNPGRFSGRGRRRRCV